MRRIKTIYFRNLHVNPVIKFLTYSDILMLSGWGLINPIIAVYFTDQVKGGDLTLVGLSSTVYFLVKSFLQIPIARYIDYKKGERDDYWLLVLGSFVITLCGFMYIFVSLPWHVYAVQFLYGIGGALAYPSWQAIFTRHIDRNEEGFEWSLYYTSTDLGSALTAGLGSLIATVFGYYWVFLCVGFASLLGTALLMGIYLDIRKK